MKWEYVKKAVATVLAVAMLAVSGEGVTLQAEGQQLPVEQAREEAGAAATQAAMPLENADGVITGTCGANATYKFENGVLTISGTGAAEDSFGSFREDIKKLVVEEGITGIPSFGIIGNGYVNLAEVSLPDSVKELPSSAFGNCKGLKEIIIPAGVQEIGSFSFEGCTALTKVTAPGVKLIKNWSFSDCPNLAVCTFDKDVQIAWMCFKGCTSLIDQAGIMRVENILCGIDPAKTGKNLIIPEGITGIAFGALYANATNITSIYLPSTMYGKEQGPGNDIYLYGDLIYELLGVKTLESINVSEKNPWYTQVDGCLLNKERTKLLVVPDARKGSYDVPKGVNTIGYAALSRCAYLTKATIPESVENVEWLGVATENQAPLYFQGNAPKGIASVRRPENLSIFYDKYYDSQEFIQRLNGWENSAVEFEQNIYKEYKGLFAKYANWEVHYPKGTVGWNSLKAEYPRIQKWIEEKKDSQATKSYTITYKLNKGKNNKNNPKLYTDKKVTLKNPTRKNYIFKGWYTDSKYKKKITSIPKGAKQNYILYAKWAKVTSGATKITSAKNSKSKQLAVKYKKVSGVKGYEISYSTNGRFQKSVKKKTTAKTADTLTNLKKGKTYYIRIRTYKLDSTKNKVYSKYTKIRKVKIGK